MRWGSRLHRRPRLRRHTQASSAAVGNCLQPLSPDHASCHFQRRHVCGTAYTPPAYVNLNPILISRRKSLAQEHASQAASLQFATTEGWILCEVQRRPGSGTAEQRAVHRTWPPGLQTGCFPGVAPRQSPRTFSGSAACPAWRPGGAATARTGSASRLRYTHVLKGLAHSYAAVLMCWRTGSLAPQHHPQILARIALHLRCAHQGYIKATLPSTQAEQARLSFFTSQNKLLEQLESVHPYSPVSPP